jgi:ribosomal protein L11 methyltransferase
MPYRVDFRNHRDDLLNRLLEFGALDVECSDDGTTAALLPDAVAPEQIASALGVRDLSVSPAISRDNGSVWILVQRPIRIGRIQILPAHAAAAAGALRLVDAAAFGTGLHPTTALCLEMLDSLTQHVMPDALLDVGTGSGVLALAALSLGVPRALGIDVDAGALPVAAENARVNGLEDRLRLQAGGPGSASGRWPLVMANVLAAPLIEMAPALVRCVGHHGHLVLSGIPSSVEPDVDRAYRHLGMRRVSAKSRGGWVALVLQASW